MVAGDGGSAETKTVCPTVKRGKIQKRNSIQCRACGTINISKNIDNFLSTNPTTIILCSFKVNSYKESKSAEKRIYFLTGEGGWECG